MKKLMALTATLMFAALAVGCNKDDNANKPGNSNVAVVNTNTNANANKAPTKEDVEKDKEKYAKQAKESGRTVGTGANDMYLWAKARFDLAAANDLRDSTINVDVNNGVITLTGTVASKDQLKRADAIAKAVEGNKGVQNKLKVAAGNTNTNSNKNANTKK